MSSIVQFPLERVAPRSRKQASAAAEIIIFPGVRIERKQQAAARTTLSRKRRNTQVAVEQDFE